MQSPRPLVMHVIPNLGLGGAEHMLALLTTAQRDGAPRQVVVDLKSGGALTERIRAAGVPVHALGTSTALTFPLAVLRLAALIRRERPAAIQGWLYYGDLAATWALKLSGRRDVTRLYWGVRCSDLDLSRYGAPLRLAIAASARRSGEPDAVVANSYAGRTAHRALGYAPRAFPVIPNGIDTARFRPDAEVRARLRAQWGVGENERIVVHAARVDPMKNHDAVLALATALPAVRFVLAGTGTEALSLPANAIALGPRHDMPAVYAAADIALSASLFGEGFPNVIAEAMACGAPAVATDVGDSRLIVGDTGLVVPPGDNAALAAAVTGLLEEPGTQRRDRAALARRRIETQFSLARAVAAFDALHVDAMLPAHSAGETAR